MRLLFAAMILTLLGAVSALAQNSLETLRIFQGDGTVKQLNIPGDRAFVADPSVADVEAVGTNALYIFGVSVGQTSIAVTDTNGDLINTFRVIVARNPNQANRDANRLSLPGDVGVTYLGDRPIISGTVNNPQTAARVEVLRGQLDGETSAVDLTDYTGKTQIQLDLVIAEVQTSGLRNLGLDFNLNNAIGLLSVLESRGVAQVLAEPSLVTTNLQTASIFSGGDFTLFAQDGDDTARSAQEFGIALEFTPRLIDNATVSVDMNVEVSSVSENNQAGAGLGRTVRRVSNTIEMKSNRTYGVAGLFQQSSDQTTSKVTGLGGLPVIGQLFRSSGLQATESELLVLVTPTILGNQDNIVQENARVSPEVTDLVGFTLRPELMRQ